MVSSLHCYLFLTSQRNAISFGERESAIVVGLYNSMRVTLDFTVSSLFFHASITTSSAVLLQFATSLCSNSHSHLLPCIQLTGPAVEV